MMQTYIERCLNIVTIPRACKATASIYCPLPYSYEYHLLLAPTSMYLHPELSPHLPTWSTLYDTSPFDLCHGSFACVELQYNFVVFPLQSSYHVCLSMACFSPNFLIYPTQLHSFPGVYGFPRTKKLRIHKGSIMSL